MSMYAHVSCIYIIFVLYLMNCISYAYHIIVVSGGISSINLGGLQADFKGVWDGLGGRQPLQKKCKECMADLS